MIARIEKELCNPVSVNGYCEVPGPLYHIYKVHDDGTKEFVKTVEKDIKEAAREAQRVIDINVLEVAYKEKGPEAFSSVGPVPSPDNFVPNSDFFNRFKVIDNKELNKLIMKELTWEDIRRIGEIGGEMLTELGEFTQENMLAAYPTEQLYYEEVLKRFNEEKNNADE